MTKKHILEEEDQARKRLSDSPLHTLLRKGSEILKSTMSPKEVEKFEEEISASN